MRAKESAPGPNIKDFEEELTLTELNKALKKLKPRKSPGPDKIHNEMLTHLGLPGKKSFFVLLTRNGIKASSKIAGKLQQSSPS